MLVMTKSRSPKTVCICVFFCVFSIGDFAGSSVRKIYAFHLVAKSPLLACHFQRLLLSSSFQQNWFYVFRTSIAKVIAFPVCEKEFLTFHICLYNILLDYDVSLHNLVVLVVTIPTSPRLSKTEFICKSYGVLFFCLDLARRWSGVSGPGRSLRPKDPESPVSRFSVLCAQVWCAPGLGPEVPRRWGGVSGINDRESPVPVFSLPFVLLWCGSVGSPEHPRRVPGVSGLAGVSGPNDRNLRPSTSPARPESPVTYTGVSGLNGPNG